MRGEAVENGSQASAPRLIAKGDGHQIRPFDALAVGLWLLRRNRRDRPLPFDREAGLQCFDELATAPDTPDVDAGTCKAFAESGKTNSREVQPLAVENDALFNRRQGVFVELVEIVGSS